MVSVDGIDHLLPAKSIHDNTLYEPIDDKKERTAHTIVMAIDMFSDSLMKLQTIPIDRIPVFFAFVDPRMQASLRRGVIYIGSQSTSII